MSRSHSFKVIDNKSVPFKFAHAYEKVTNEKIVHNSSHPKFCFETRELYEQADTLSRKVPIYKNDNDNPICHYISKTGLRYGKAIRYPTSIKSSSSLNNIRKNKLNESFITNNVENSKIFQLTFKKEDCFKTKAKLAKKDPVVDTYIDPYARNFRDFTPSYGRKEFCVI